MVLLVLVEMIAVTVIGSYFYASSTLREPHKFAEFNTTLPATQPATERATQLSQASDSEIKPAYSGILPSDIFEVIEVDWPEPPEEYLPDKTELLALVDETWRRQVRPIVGDVMFLDKNNNIFRPDSKAEYYRMRNNCIFLFDGSGNMAIMRLDGKVVTGYHYQEDELGEEDRHGFVLVSKRAQDDEVRYGMVSVETGEEVIQPEYDGLCMFDAYVLASKEGQRYLIDYEGTVFFAFEKGLEVNSVSGYMGYRFWPHDDYLLDYENNILFRNRNKSDVAYDVDFGGSYCLICRVVDPYDTYHLFELNGKHILTFKGYHHYDGENWIIMRSNRTTVLKKDGEMLEIPCAILGIAYDPVYQDGLISYHSYVGDMIFDDKREDVIIDEEGNEVSRTAAVKETIEEEWLKVFPESVLEKYSRSIYPIGESDFLIAKIDAAEKFAYQADIYNRSGELLLEDVYGIIGARKDHMVIYTGDKDAYLLHSDGRLEPIPEANGVKE